jgi:hypothetical protein
MSAFLTFNSTDRTTGDQQLFAGASIPPIVFEPSGFETFLTGIASTDASGTLFIDQSFDGEDWDLTNTFNINAGDNLFEMHFFAPFMQVRYTNGSEDQSYLRFFIRTVPTRNNR